MPFLLSCQKLGKSYGIDPLFREISFSLAQGDKVGVIGPNGSGKSTFLKILAGLEKMDEGNLVWQPGLRLEYVNQETLFSPELTIWQVFEAELSRAIADPVERETQIQIISSQVGFDQLDILAQSLSGGWKKRLALAIALAKQPEVLLLDEPTNHLDMEGILWLEQTLAKMNQTAMIISHDRYFLENVTNQMVEISAAYPQGLFKAKGNYSEFLLHKEQFLSGQLQHERALASRVRREIEWLKRGPKARTTKSQARIKEAHRFIQELATVKERNTAHQVEMEFAGSERKTKKLIEGKQLSCVIEQKVLFNQLDVELIRGCCLGILGANGSGKSSLLRILKGLCPPSAGSIHFAEGVRTVYFDQYRQSLDPELTIAQTLAMRGDFVIYRGDTMHVTAWAKRFLFPPQRLQTAVGHLSGGERARLLLAKFMLEPADVLLLDEPTNDLDILTLEILEQSLRDFDGAIVLVTHDRYLLEKISTQILALEANGKTGYYADYFQWLEEKKEQTERVKSREKREVPAVREALSVRTVKKLSYREQCELKSMESDILAAEERATQLQTLSATPEIAANLTQLQLICQQLQQVQQQIEQLYSRWQELEQKQR